MAVGIKLSLIYLATSIPNPNQAMPQPETSTLSLTKELAENITALLIIADPAGRTMRFLQQWPIHKFNLPSEYISFEGFSQSFNLNAETKKQFQESQYSSVPFSFVFDGIDAGNKKFSYRCDVKTSGSVWVITGVEQDNKTQTVQPTVADDFA